MTTEGDDQRAATPRTEPGAPRNGAVWLRYDQAALDAQYDQRRTVPEAPARMAAWEAASAEARARLAPRELAYGPDPVERLHVYAGRPGAPAHLHLHGGAWRIGSKSECGHLAPALVAEGAWVLVPDFALAPAASLPTMVGQVRRAALWARDGAARFGWAEGPLHVSGHSSGAHLAAMLTTADWPEGRDLVASLTLLSGVYDLEPVRLSARNDYLRLDRKTAARFSPIRGFRRPPPPAALFAAERDHDEFRRQSAEFADALAVAGGAASLKILPGLDHFSIVDRFAEPESEIARAARAFMRGAAPA